jgi:hypothetical protein
MNEGAIPEKLSPYEKVLLASEVFPWDALHRGAIGFVLLPLMARIWRGNHSEWILVPFLLVILLLLRVVPAVVRKLVSFPAAVQNEWTRRRRIAKRYDSYQWQKLFWVGLGLATYTAYSGQYLISRIVVSSICLVAGGIGLAIWRLNASRLEPSLIVSKKALD